MARYVHTLSISSTGTITGWNATQPTLAADDVIIFDITSNANTGTTTLTAPTYVANALDAVTAGTVVQGTRFILDTSSLTGNITLTGGLLENCETTEIRGNGMNSTIIDIKDTSRAYYLETRNCTITSTSDSDHDFIKGYVLSTGSTKWKPYDYRKFEMQGSFYMSSSDVLDIASRATNTADASSFIDVANEARLGGTINLRGTNSTTARLAVITSKKGFGNATTSQNTTANRNLGGFISGSFSGTNTTGIAKAITTDTSNGWVTVGGTLSYAQIHGDTDYNPDPNYVPNPVTRMYNASPGSSNVTNVYNGTLRPRIGTGTVSGTYDFLQGNLNISGTVTLGNHQTGDAYGPNTGGVNINYLNSFSIPGTITGSGTLKVNTANYIKFTGNLSGFTGTIEINGASRDFYNQSTSFRKTIVEFDSSSKFGGNVTIKNGGYFISNGEVDGLIDVQSGGRILPGTARPYAPAVLNIKRGIKFNSNTVTEIITTTTQSSRFVIGAVGTSIGDTDDRAQLAGELRILNTTSNTAYATRGYDILDVGCNGNITKATALTGTWTAPTGLYNSPGITGTFKAPVYNNTTKRVTLNNETGRLGVNDSQYSVCAISLNYCVGMNTLGSTTDGPGLDLFTFGLTSVVPTANRPTTGQDFSYRVRWSGTANGTTYTNKLSRIQTATADSFNYITGNTLGVAHTSIPLGALGESLGNFPVSGGTNQATITKAELLVGGAAQFGICPGESTTISDDDDRVIASNDTVTYDDDEARTISGDLSGTGTITKEGTGTLTLSGDNTFTGTINVNEGTVEITNANTDFKPTVMIASDATYKATESHTVESVNGAGDVDIPTGKELSIDPDSNKTSSNKFTGGGRARKRGSRNFTLSNQTNTISGGFTVDGGCLAMVGIDSFGTLPTTSRANHIILNNNACLLVDSSTVTGRITRLPRNAGTTVNGNTTIISKDGLFDKESPITGNGSVTFEGQGSGLNTIRLRDNNTYNGNTVIKPNTTLDLNNLQTGNSLSGNVSSEGDIRGKGTINGNVTISSGGRFLPGVRPGDTLTINGSLTLGNGSTTYIAMTNSTSDKVIVNGNMTIGSDVDLILTPYNNSIDSNFSSDLFTISSGNSITGTFNTPVDYKDNISGNGIDTIPNSDYPNLDTTTDTNKIILSR